jgi:hypothetical protein
MADPAVLGLIGTLSGTAIGFAGGLLTQLIMDSRKRASDRRNKREEQLVALVSAVYEHNHWLHTNYRLMARGDHDKLLVTPFSKIEAIKQVYFPQFAPLVTKLGAATHEYEKWLILKADAIGTINLPEPLSRERSVLFGNYILCSGALLDEIAKYAKCEFQ